MVVETKRRILNYHRNNVEARQELNIQPRWNYDISRQLKDLETRQRWTKARAMGRAQHDSVGRKTTKPREKQTPAEDCSKRHSKKEGRKCVECQKTKVLCSRNAGCTSRPHKDGIQGKGLQSTLGESIKPLGNGGRCCSKEVFDTRRWDEAHKLKECHCKQMKNLYSQSSFIAKVIKKDPKRNDTRPHGMSYHEKGVVSDILRTSRMDDSDTKNDCIVLYEDLQQIPQMSSGRVRIEVIYSKEQIKRSQNTAQVGEGCSGRVLYMDDVSYVSPSLHEDAQRCQSSTVTGLHGIADKDDLREFFRRPMKPVLDKAIHESRRNCRSTHSLCQSKKLANFIPHITASRVSESASLIILNPEALKNISFTRFWPPSTRN